MIFRHTPENSQSRLIKLVLSPINSFLLRLILRRAARTETAELLVRQRIEAELESESRTVGQPVAV
jgi:hypothetical protein